MQLSAPSRFLGTDPKDPNLETLVLRYWSVIMKRRGEIPYARNIGLPAHNTTGNAAALPAHMVAITSGRKQVQMQLCTPDRGFCAVIEQDSNVEK